MRRIRFKIRSLMIAVAASALALAVAPVVFAILHEISQPQEACGFPDPNFLPRALPGGSGGLANGLAPRGPQVAGSGISGTPDEGGIGLADGVTEGAISAEFSSDRTPDSD